MSNRPPRHPKPTEAELQAHTARLERRRKLRLELLDLCDQQSINPAKYVDDQSAVAMARHRVEHCELAIRIFELEYPSTAEVPLPYLNTDGAAVPD